MDLADALILQGRVLSRREHLEAAAEAFEEAAGIRRARLVPGHWQAAAVTSLHGECLGQLGRFESAESLLLTSADEPVAALSPAHVLAKAAVRRTSALYEAWQKPKEAARIRAGYPARASTRRLPAGQHVRPSRKRPKAAKDPACRCQYQ
jgi:hypothetical protein